MLYHAHDLFKSSMKPARAWIKMSKTLSENPYNPMSKSYLRRAFSAKLEIAERLTRSYKKPEFGIDSVMIDGEKIAIKQKTIVSKPFCNLLHFSKNSTINKPKLLIVAPMSGHHATLLRGTVEGALADFDVYITDWIDAKMVPVSEGGFDLDDFIDYVIEFMELLAPNLNVMAVCQPTVPVLAGISIMYSNKSKQVPDSMILMGGPIDTRKSPTNVDTFAYERTMSWFKSNLITQVPVGHPGYRRNVYPGFLQLTGFVMMNVRRHYDAHMKLYNTIVAGEEEKAELQRKFYDEYFSVMDMTAEFYLQTIDVVFKKHDLPLGNMVSRGRKIDPSLITDTALLGIEGEFDDITGIGQTKAALCLCKNLADSKKQYYLQKEVGHFGVFSGRRFREQVMPVVKNFVYNNIKMK